ncbi:MAG: hypothetical protein ACRD01_03475 [Terriglobales bacterium]
MRPGGVYCAGRGYKDGAPGLTWAGICAIAGFYDAILQWERAAASPP